MVYNLIDLRNDVNDQLNHEVQLSGFISKFLIFAYFQFCICFFEINVALHGTSFSLSITLLTIVLDQLARENVYN